MLFGSALALHTVLIALIATVAGIGQGPVDSCGAAMAKKEQTFIMIKPDGVARGLVGEIIKRFESKVSCCCNFSALCLR